MPGIYANARKPTQVVFSNDFDCRLSFDAGYSESDWIIAFQTTGTFAFSGTAIIGHRSFKEGSICTI